MYRIALLGQLWGVWSLLLSIPIIGMVKVVSHHIEELHLVDELLKNAGVPPYDVVLSALRRMPYLSIDFLNATIPNNSYVPTEFVVSGCAYRPFCAGVQTAAARLPTPDRINFLNR